jgi:hypothetical protein
MADKPALTDRERIEALEAQVANLSAALAAETTERMAEVAALSARLQISAESAPAEEDEPV